jgi:hypothetical protein
MMSVDTVSRLSRAISDLERGLEPGECLVDINGQLHDEGEHCANSTYDDFNRLRCKAHDVRKLRRQREDVQWMPSILEYYWQHGVAGKGLEFLDQMDFVYLYKYV